ncbi:MAG: hypothetical protein RIT04_647 [Candidatus Parcubacteria bacterium]|jgi:ribosomal protein S18 acetylase RimI-like enzyme
MENLENIKEKIQITSATREDLPGMQEVFYRSWLATYPNEELGITTEDIEDRFKDSFTEECFAKRWERIQNAKNEELFLAKIDGVVIGVCRVVKHTDRNQLQAIYILPEYKGKGIGTLLWDEVKKVIDPNLDTVVEVATYNTPAIAFYAKLGFEDTGRRFTDERFKLKSGAVIPEMEMAIKGK